ncbi:MAG: hypothetical protein EAX91_01115 [Candidatus Lokiarchaeota archaeon]|nr:hypothetical protein [Candidatus Lokiarchaeota archaeon]
MTEIKKITKISLIWYTVAGFLFAFMFIVLTDFTMSFMQWPYNDPIDFWFQGGTMLVLAITTLLALFKKEWEGIKLFFFLVIIWDIMVLIMDIVAVAILNFSETTFLFMITFIILLSFNLVIGLVSWMTQRR